MTARTRKSENIFYAIMWVVVILLYITIVMRRRSAINVPPFSLVVLVQMTLSLAPYMLLFAISNFILIPKLLMRNRIWAYIGYMGITLVGICGYLTWAFGAHGPEFEAMHPEDWMRGAPGMHIDDPDMKPRHIHGEPLLPLPLLLDFTYTLLVAGLNLAVALLARHIDDRMEREKLLKANAETQLTYLKTQINPHFYMNMLNNIHGMIDIDPERAQSMVIDMSNLMRYMLYDSSRRWIPLGEEIAFVRNYLKLMRQRYPESRVSIAEEYPHELSYAGIEVPPLLLLVFLENAFKHGISYNGKSFVKISIHLDGNRVRFTCANSMHADDHKHDTSGIGLSNVKQRLELLYGSEASLDINKSDDSYVVNLTVPRNEIKHADN